MRMVVLGSLMQDLVVRVPRLPLVGESLLGHEFAVFPGGKGGNAAIASARLGASCHMVGRVGTDPFGGQLIAALQADGVDCSFVQRDPANGTGIAVPMVFDDGRNSIISVPRANLAMTAADAEAAREVIASADVLIVQFEVAMEATMAAIRIARHAGVAVLLNAAPITPYPPEALRLATYLVVNDVEAAAIAPEAGGDHAREATELLARGPGAVVVTLGELGSVVATQDGAAFVAPFLVEAIDSVGAGDAFCAAFAFAMGTAAPARRDPVAAARFANAAGALAVTRPGAAPSLPRFAEVQAMLGAEAGS
ncbi:MAG: ribokinase [Tepidiformaceae bacterium]